MFIFLILFTPFVNASYSYVFQKDNPADVKITCFDENKTLCSCATDCYLTINKPDSTNLIEGSQMTCGTNYFNYTLNSSQTSDLREYNVISRCVGGTSNGYSTFNYLISYNGKEPPSDFVKVLFILGFIALLTIMLITLMFMLGHFAKFDVDLLDVAYMFAVYFAVFATKYFNIAYMGSELIDSFADLFITTGAMTHIFLPLVAFVVSYFKRRLELKKENV
jgi:hypothetical protein